MRLLSVLQHTRVIVRPGEAAFRAPTAPFLAETIHIQSCLSWCEEKESRKKETLLNDMLKEAILIKRTSCVPMSLQAGQTTLAVSIKLANHEPYH
jgi:hypothetical protein